VKLELLISKQSKMKTVMNSNSLTRSILMVRRRFSEAVTPKKVLKYPYILSYGITNPYRTFQGKVDLVYGRYKYKLKVEKRINPESMSRGTSLDKVAKSLICIF